MMPLTARVTPLCAVETCQRPLNALHGCRTVWLMGRITHVCRDCAATLGRER